MKAPSPLILLSTYNGEKWIKELLESLKLQSLKNWTLLVRDDGSNDKTVDILKNFSKNDSRLILIEDSLGNLGPTQSFSKLLEISLSYPQEHVFFCDQDDIWLTHKLETLSKTLNDYEFALGRETPILLHSQLKTIDESGQTLNASYHNQMNFDPEFSQEKLSHLLVQNFVVGCSSAINKSLAKIASPIPKHALMHDWWCALIACTLGKIVFVDEALTLYRVHSGNASGAGKKNRILDFFNKPQKYFELIEQRIAQAKELSQRLHSRTLNNKNPKIFYLNTFIKTLEDKSLNAFFKSRNLDLQMQGIDRSLFFYVTLLLRSLRSNKS